MAETKSVCPYYGGVTQRGRKYLVKCGNDFFECETKEKADNKVSVCGEQMENCRPFLFRKLKEIGVGPTSEWSKQQLRDEYLEQIQSQGGKEMNEITSTQEEVKPVRSHVIIAAEINQIKDQTRKIVMFNAIEIGRRLVEAKEVVAHGEWANWLKDSVDFSQSTANNMMRLFEEYGSNQMALFGDNIKSQTFGNLSYSQAVALLAVPEEEREQFVEDNEIETLSVREIERLVKEKKELEDKLKKAESENEVVLSQKKDLLSRYNTLDDSLRDTKEKLNQAITEQNKIKQSAQEEKDKLLKQIEEAKVAGNTEDAEKLQSDLDEMEKELADSVQKIAELEKQLKEKPIETTATVEVVPEEVGRELAELREKTKELEAKAAGKDLQPVVKFQIYFEELVKGFDNLLRSLDAVKDTDQETHDKYRNAVTGLIGRMTERLN